MIARGASGFCEHPWKLMAVNGVASAALEDITLTTHDVHRYYEASALGIHRPIGPVPLTRHDFNPHREPGVLAKGARTPGYPL
jgi:hypothetical protein